LADITFGFNGEAFSTRVRLAGGTLLSGPSALASVGCTTQGGITSHNSAASISVPGILSSGTADNNVSTAAVGGVHSTHSTSTIQNVSLLGGLISADALTADATTSWDGSAFNFQDGSTFANLVVAGQSLGVNVTPNSRIDLAGLGHVVLREQSRNVTGSSARQSINMIHVYVTEANPFGLSIGSDILVGHVKANLEGPTVAQVGGVAYGSGAWIFAGSTTTVAGPSFPANVPCRTGTVTNTAAGITLPGLGLIPSLGSTGTINDEATATYTPTTSTAQTSSTVQNVNLLAGTVQATLIKAVANASTDGTTPSFSDTGSTVASLVVLGVPVNVSGSTVITVPGIGKLRVFSRVQTASSIEVRGLELVVNNPLNAFGLTVGTVIRVAVARSKIL
jgi:hypothetical protein